MKGQKQNFWINIHEHICDFYTQDYELFKISS